MIASRLLTVACLLSVLHVCLPKSEAAPGWPLGLEFHPKPGATGEGRCMKSRFEIELSERDMGHRPWYRDDDTQASVEISQLGGWTAICSGTELNTQFISVRDQSDSHAIYHLRSSWLDYDVEFTSPDTIELIRLNSAPTSIPRFEGVYVLTPYQINGREVYVNEDVSRFLAWHGSAWAVGRLDQLPIWLDAPNEPFDFLVETRTSWDAGGPASRTSRFNPIGGFSESHHVGRSSYNVSSKLTVVYSGTVQLAVTFQIAPQRNFLQCDGTFRQTADTFNRHPVFHNGQPLHTDDTLEPPSYSCVLFRSEDGRWSIDSDKVVRRAGGWAEEGSWVLPASYSGALTSYAPSADPAAHWTAINVEYVGDCGYRNAEGAECIDECAAVNGLTLDGEGRCFFTSEETLSWEDAEALCVQHGGHLASIRDQEEDNLVYELYTGNAQFWPLANRAWIGVNDRDGEGVFHNADLSFLDLNTTNWADGEPNDFDGREDCGEIRMWLRTWNDNDCTREQPFVCTKEVAAPCQVQCAA